MERDGTGRFPAIENIRNFRIIKFEIWDGGQEMSMIDAIGFMYDVIWTITDLYLLLGHLEVISIHLWEKMFEILPMLL
jgi:hypothetical protein